MIPKGIVINGRQITTPVVLSTYGGHWGTGLMPVALSPRYVKFMNLIRESGTVQLVKSSTFRFRRGNFRWYNIKRWRFVQSIGNRSKINSYAHTNLGIFWNVRFIRIANQLGFKAIVNFAPDFSKYPAMVIAEVFYAITQAKKILGAEFIAFEIVPSCPNRKYCVAGNIKVMADIIRFIKAVWPDLIIIIKKGKDHPTEAVVEWECAGMDILHGINAVRYDLVFPGQRSPLADVGGGAVSGADITAIAFEDNLKSRKATSVPMIFGGGNMTVDDIQRCFDNGADSASICTVASEDPSEAEKIIRTFNF